MALVRPPLGYMAKLLMIPDSLKSVIDDKKRIIGHLISAQIPDREGDVLIAKGGRFDTFLSSNPGGSLQQPTSRTPCGAPAGGLAPGGGLPRRHAIRGARPTAHAGRDHLPPVP